MKRFGFNLFQGFSVNSFDALASLAVSYSSVLILDSGGLFNESGRLADSFDGVFCDDQFVLLFF